MAIADDFSIATNGDIRRTGTGTTTYTGLAFHRYLGSHADDDEASGDDLHDITSDTASERATDNIITLNTPYNIDDTVARFLYDASLTQNSGDDVYSGLKVLGSVVAGTEIMIVQDDKVLAPYWGTGLNPDAANNVIMQVMIKTRVGGADIDGKRLTTRAMELGDQYKEFKVTLGLGVGVSAISTLDDLNNNTADATIEGWTTITNVEGFQLIDIDNDGSDEEYYAKPTKGSQSLNDVFEFMKWVQQRSHITDNGTDTGNDFIVDNATILGQGQEFTARPLDEKLVEMRFRLKVGAGTPTGPLTAELWLSDVAGAGLADPTGSVLATSEEVLASQITAAYVETVFRFTDNVTMTGGEKYFAVIRHPNGGASDRFAVEGSTSGADDGNRAEDTGTWAATAADDLWFTAKSSRVWHTRPGELMRGIDVEVVYDAEAGGPFTENEILFWGTRVPYDGIASGPFVVGDYVTFEPSGGGAVTVGGKILKETATRLIVALDNTAGGILLDNDIMRVVGKATTAAVDFPSYTGGGATDLDFVNATSFITRTTGSWSADGYEVGDRIVITGSASNNGTLTIGTVAASDLTIDEGVTEELNVAATATIKARDDTASGGEGVLLALDDNGVTGDVYLQVISGANPVDNLIFEGRSSGATALVNATITARPISPEFIGATTGTNLIGAYGIGFTTTDVGASDKFFDLTNTLRTPPNNVTFTVTGMVSGEDRILVGPRTGSVLNKAFLTTDTTLSGATETLIQCSTAIPTDTPGSGTGADNTRVRVQLDTGIYRRVQYDSYSGDDFTITTGPDDDWTGANVSTFPKDVFVAYMDVLADATSEAYTAVYKGSDNNILVRIRDGGGTPIKTNEINAVFGSASSSVAATRISDL